MADASNPVAAGGIVTYTITVSNTGTEDEDGVVVDDTLSGPATIVKAVPSQGACNPPTASTVHCSPGTIGALFLWSAACRDRRRRGSRSGCRGPRRRRLVRAEALLGLAEP